MEKENKTNSIYVMKILFTYMIALFHYPAFIIYVCSHGGTMGWYIAVEFFFIVSGYLLYKKIKSDGASQKSAWEYTWHRYKKIWPSYLLSFVVTVFVIAVYNKYSLKQLYKRVTDSFFEIFMLQGIGLNREWDYVNPTLWYISVMLIAGFIIYWMLINYEKIFVEIIAPLVIVIAYSYLYRNVGSLNAVTDTLGLYENQALIRALADMCLGIYAVKLEERFKSKSDRIAFYKIAADILVVIIIFWSLFDGASKNDFIFVFVFVYIVAAGFLPRRRMKIDYCIEKWSSITLEIYLVHEVYRMYIMNWVFPNMQIDRLCIKEIMVYMILITITAAVIHTGVIFIDRRIKQK